MTNTISTQSTSQATPQVRIETIARNLPPAAAEDFRALMNTFLQNLSAQAPGGNLIRPGGTPAGAGTAPVGVTASVNGGNGVFTVSITRPSSANASQTIYVEVSYATDKTFTQNVTTMPVTTASTVTVQAPGGMYFFRMRSSFDQKTWSGYILLSNTAVNAGLVQSAAMASGAAFNQTNFMTVNSQAAGGAAVVTIQGAGGSLTAGTHVKGAVESVRPAAAIAGVTPGSNQFVGWDGSQYQLKPTLASVLADNLEPVGKVSVVTSAPPTLPTIVPIISGGGVVGFNVTSGGSGASQDYILTITDPTSGSASGATAGMQTIVAGVLISVAPGNAGANYDSHTVVTPSGGSGGGASGGGTSIGGNGGRLTAV